MIIQAAIHTPCNFRRFGTKRRPSSLQEDYYYDAAHDCESQLNGLRLVEPHLVPGALMIVDDADWDRVARAMDDYLAAQPRARRLLTIDGKDRGQPWWWEGMQVLVWDGG